MAGRIQGLICSNNSTAACAAVKTSYLGGIKSKDYSCVSFFPLTSCRGAAYLLCRGKSERKHVGDVRSRNILALISMILPLTIIQNRRRRRNHCVLDTCSISSRQIHAEVPEKWES